MQLKKIELELSDDFSEAAQKERKKYPMPYHKRWRMWIAGVYIGDILKFYRKKGPNEFQVRLNRVLLEPDLVEYEDKKWNREKRFDRKDYNNLKSLQEAKERASELIIRNLKTIIE